MHVTKRVLCFVSGASLFSPWLTALAAADAATQDDEKLQEVIVTAQKREQNLQSVGVSVTALDSSALAKLGFNDVTQVASQVPGLQVNQYGATVTVYNIRGVSQNDFTDHQETPVAVYNDDAYVAATGALAGAVYDLARVEVLRGPQGTLFGRNATGGLIQYVSEKPTDNNEGYLNAALGNFRTIDSEGALNARLSDSVDARLSFAQNYHQGYIENTLGHPIEDQNQIAGRVQFLFKLADGGQIIWKVHGINNDSEVAGNYTWTPAYPGGPNGRGTLTPPDYTGWCPQIYVSTCVPGGDLGGYKNPSSDPYVQSMDRRGIFNRTVWGSTLHYTDTFGGVALTSVTDYLHMNKRYGEDSDMSPNPEFNYDVFQNFQQFSEELRLNGQLKDFRWITGLYYLNYHTADKNYVELDPLLGGLSYAIYGLHDQTGAVFGQIEYDLTSQLTFIGGARYTYDDKKFDLNYQPQNLIYNPSTFPGAARNFSIPTGKVELDFKPTSNLLFYAGVNWGAKGGGWTAVTSGFADPSKLPYDTEKLTSYEGGFKSTFWDGAARLNGSIFHYDYKDYQGFFLSGLTQVVENVNARVNGGELEFSVVPTRGLNIQIGLSNLSSQANDVPFPDGTLGTTELPQAPRWSANAMVNYDWPIMGGKLSIEGDGKWDAQQYMELLNNPDDLQPAYAVYNARLSYTSANGAWDVGGYIRNIADKVYMVYGLDLSGLGIDQRVVGPPRTYGVTFTYRWGK